MRRVDIDKETKICEAEEIGDCDVGCGAQVWLALILLPPCAVFLAFQFGPCKRGWEREEAVGGTGEKIYGTFEGSEELEPLVGSVDPSPEPEL
jgi:hypothetical protein